ncbi:energy transducer TonB [Halomonas sp. TBZ9]|uniref:Protein TonB n=1 Tax=Vreelandella azerica TaxID=2732867 RepID=A0A7Y3TVE7_9GAMM|nr:energy transducer TonB [Halomonas azerica]NOG30986.1 energy transducer TonB [Halomonas azerica]
MIRHLLSMLGGMTLAVGLFWLLALLVTPPERPVEAPEMTLSMTLLEATESTETPPEQAAQTPAASESLPDTETPPPQVEQAPDALPDADSQVVVNDSEAPEPKPEPEPGPKPKPKPKPEPEPGPEPEPEPTPQADAASKSTAEHAFASPQQDAPAQAQAAPSDEPVSVGQLAPASRVNPTYPRRAQRRGLEGFVEVTFVIRRDGSVDSSTIRVTRAQPKRVFEEAALDAIARWQFEASEQLRRATQRIEFQLR